MEEIRQIIENLEIPEKKEQLHESRRRMSTIKQQMSDLTIHQSVAQYVHDLDTIEYYKRFRENLTKRELANTQRELAAIEDRRQYLDADPFVQEYQRLFGEFLSEKRSADVYYQTIQKDLRTELLDLNIPDIYIYQGFTSSKKDFKLCRNIIIPNSVITFVDPSEIATLIFKVKDREEETLTPKENLSYREAKKLYNKVSYRYLEGLTNDYSFDLEGKNLGNVIIHRRGR